MASSQNSGPGKQGYQPSPEELQALVKRVATAPLLYLPEADRPDPEPFIVNIANTMKETVQEEDGRRSLPGFTLRMANWVFDNWTPWKNDVIISTFPKTGTTWVYDIATEILYKDEPKMKQMIRDIKMHRYLEGGIEEKYDVFEKLPWKRRLLATHLCEELVNVKKITDAGAKIICTIRNPKDQMVSLYHMIQNLPTSPVIVKELIGEGWNDYFNNVIAGKIPILQKNNEWYPDHLLGWHKHRNNDNVLFVVFEDLKIDLQKEIQRIAEFLDVDLNNEELARIVDATTFQSMKQNAKPEEKMINFFRKGEIGNWKEYFTVAQSEIVDRIMEAKLSGTGITFIYE